MNKFSKLKPNKKYHIICHANGRDNLFREKENYRFFLQRYHEILFPIVKTYAYCLMPNHFHLLVEIRSESDLAKINDGKYEITNFISKKISNLLNAYAKAFNKKYSRKGSLFIRPFSRIPVEDDAYFTNLVSYIHLNPIKHRFVKKLNKWEHSSWHIYKNELMESNLELDYIYNWFGGKELFLEFHLKEEESLLKYLDLSGF